MSHGRLFSKDQSGISAEVNLIIDDMQKKGWQASLPTRFYPCKESSDSKKATVEAIAFSQRYSGISKTYDEDYKEYTQKKNELDALIAELGQSIAHIKSSRNLCQKLSGWTSVELEELKVPLRNKIRECTYRYGCAMYSDNVENMLDQFKKLVLEEPKKEFSAFFICSYDLARKEFIGLETYSKPSVPEEILPSGYGAASISQKSRI